MVAAQVEDGQLSEFLYECECGHVGRTVKNGGGEMESRKEEWELEEEEEEGGRRKRYVWRRGRGGSGEGREGRRGVGGGESTGVEDDEKKSSQLTVMVARYYTLGYD